MAQQKRIERFENVLGSHPGAHLHRQRLPRELIENRQHLVGPPVAEPVVYEVDGPDMVRMRGPQADDRAVLVIKPLALPVALRKLQPFFAPESLDFLVIDPPALDVEQFGDFAITISAVLLRQPGGTSTTASDCTHHSTTKHPQKRAERLSNLRTSRPARLPRTQTKNLKTRLGDTRYE